MELIESITTRKTVEKFREIFSTHGLPKTVVTDNKPGREILRQRILWQSDDLKIGPLAPQPISDTLKFLKAVQSRASLHDRKFLEVQ